MNTGEKEREGERESHRQVLQKKTGMPFPAIHSPDMDSIKNQ